MLIKPPLNISASAFNIPMRRFAIIIWQLSSSQPVPVTHNKDTILKRKNLRFISIGIMLLFTAQFYNGCQRQKAAPPRLNVLLVVDQMCAEHLQRYGDLFQGGLARLLKEGRVYSEAHHDHAYTVTGAGHATLATGSFPSTSGIVGNDWYEKLLRRVVYCTEDSQYPIIGYNQQDPEDGRSPHYLDVPAIGDWLKEASPRSKVFGIAKKDRAAIMMAGQKPDGAYWYNTGDGQMVTSTYYRESYPQWVTDFNQTRSADQYFDAGWQRLLADTAVYLRARRDDFPAEGDGKGNTFPHLFTDMSDSPDPRFYDELCITPFGDQLVLNFAKACITNEQLGVDDVPDLLALSCSAADLIGHRYGPFSQEALDYYLRLDRYLGDFFDFLDETIGSEHYAVAFSSDHGVIPLPEYLQEQNVAAKRVLKGPFMNEAKGRLLKIATTFEVEPKIYENVSGFSIFLDQEILASINRENFQQTIIDELCKMEAMDTIYTAAQILAAPDDDSILSMIKRSYDQRRTGDLYFVLKENYLLDDQFGTTHGSPYRYDTHVPFIFWGPGIKKGEIKDPVRTVDLAPTLSGMMGIETPETVNGKRLF